MDLSMPAGTPAPPSPLERLTALYLAGGYGRQSAQLAEQLLADHDTETAAAKGTRDADQAPAGEPTLSSSVLDLLTAIRDALDLPLPALGTLGGWEKRARVIVHRAAAVRTATAVAVEGDRPHVPTLTASIRDDIERHPVTYPALEPEQTGGGL